MANQSRWDVDIIPEVPPAPLGVRLRELLLAQPLNPLRPLRFRELTKSVKPQAEEPADLCVA